MVCYIFGHSSDNVNLSWARSIQAIPPLPISLRSILILSTNLRLDFPSCLNVILRHSMKAIFNLFLLLNSKSLAWGKLASQTYISHVRKAKPPIRRHKLHKSPKATGFHLHALLVRQLLPPLAVTVCLPPDSGVAFEMRKSQLPRRTRA
jgi:hypothetical protein